MLWWLVLVILFLRHSPYFAKEEDDDDSDNVVVHREVDENLISQSNCLNQRKLLKRTSGVY